MQISIPFTKEEKINFLGSLGYNIITKEEKEWEQVGNHDSSGFWYTEKNDYAVKDLKELTNKSKNSLDAIFTKEMTIKIKSLLLSK